MRTERILSETFDRNFRRRSSFALRFFLSSSFFPCPKKKSRCVRIGSKFRTITVPLNPLPEVILPEAHFRRSRHKFREWGERRDTTVLESSVNSAMLDGNGIV